MKTLLHAIYCSAQRSDQTHDAIDNPANNYQSIAPEKPFAFMRDVKKPWIAFKTLAADANHPNEGLAYAAWRAEESEAPTMRAFSPGRRRTGTS